MQINDSQASGGGLCGKGIRRPYSTWPFTDKAIESLTNENPRDVLKMCEAHRKRCLTEGAVAELERFIEQPRIIEKVRPNRFAVLDRQFEALQKQAEPTFVLDHKHEDERLAPSFDTAWPTPPNSWRDEDGPLARRFLDSTEMIVWTPGRDSGIPLTLKTLPEFGPLVDFPDELREPIAPAGKER